MNHPQRREKLSYEYATKASISMPQILMDRAIARCRQLELTKLSDYIQRLVKDDTERATIQRAA